MSVLLLRLPLRHVMACTFHSCCFFFGKQTGFAQIAMPMLLGQDKCTATYCMCNTCCPTADTQGWHRVTKFACMQDALTCFAWKGLLPVNVTWYTSSWAAKEALTVKTDAMLSAHKAVWKALTQHLRRCSAVFWTSSKLLLLIRTLALLMSPMHECLLCASSPSVVAQKLSDYTVYLH